MNSFSHYAFGAVCEWMMSELAGIDRAAVGFDRIRIAPRPTGTITSASASTMTRHGELACAWKIENGDFEVKMTIPPNTTADVTLPVEKLINLEPSGILKKDGNRLTVGSGTYQFSGRFAPGLK
jgi:alpha-L-rhamnosidase